MRERGRGERTRRVDTGEPGVSTCTVQYHIDAVSFVQLALIEVYKKCMQQDACVHVVINSLRMSRRHYELILVPSCTSTVVQRGHVSYSVTKTTLLEYQMFAQRIPPAVGPPLVPDPDHVSKQASLIPRPRV